MELNLTLAVNDIDLARSFYEDLLGLQTEEADRTGVLIVTFANIKVVFQPLAQMEQQHPAFLQHLGRSALGAGVQLELNCPDLDSVESRLDQCGWPVVYELDDQEHGRREIWIQDPDGYLIVLNG